MLLCVGLALAGQTEPLLDVRDETLPNGLRVVAHQMAGSARAATRLVLPAGAEVDPAGRSGLAHLVEHLAYAGSRQAPTNSSDRWLEAAGGSTDATTEVDQVTFASQAPREALPLALFLESERLGWLEPTTEALATQRSVIAHERAAGTTSRAIREALARALWPEGHPYRRTVIGDPADLARVSLEEVRGFVRCHVRPEGAVLAVVGDAPAEALLAEARRWFVEIPRADGSCPARAASPTGVGHAAPEPAPAAGKRLWLRTDLHADAVRVSWRTVPSGHADALALEAAAWVLADRLRVDEISVGQWSGRHGGELTIEGASTRSRGLVRRVEAAVDALLRDGPTSDEVERWRATARTFELGLLELPGGRAETLTDCVASSGEPDCLPAVWAARAATTSQGVRAAANRWLRPDARILLVASGRPPFRHMTRVTAP